MDAWSLDSERVLPLPQIRWKVYSVICVLSAPSRLALRKGYPAFVLIGMGDGTFPREYMKILDDGVDIGM